MSCPTEFRTDQKKIQYFRALPRNLDKMLQQEKGKSVRHKLKTGKQRFRWNLIFNLLVWFVVLLPLWIPIVSQTVALYFIPAVQAVFVMMWVIVVILASKNMVILYRWSISYRFRKVGRVWYGGSRETREPHVTLRQTVSQC